MEPLTAEQTARRVNGYLILFDAYGKSWLITRRSNIKSLGHRTLESAVAWAEAH